MAGMTKESIMFQTVQRLGWTSVAVKGFSVALLALLDGPAERAAGAFVCLFLWALDSWFLKAERQIRSDMNVQFRRPYLKAWCSPTMVMFHLPVVAAQAGLFLRG